MQFSKSQLYPLVSLAIGATVLSGCIFGGDGKGIQKPVTPVNVQACQDLAPGPKKIADSLVVEGTAKMTADMEYLFGDSVNNWDNVKARNPQAALKIFDQALAVAPGHCGATFGRAVATSMMITQDPKLDVFVKKVESADKSPDVVRKVSSAGALFKLSPDQAPPVLLKLSAELKYVDYPTVTEFQALVADVLMPKVDSTIASLEVALKYENFAFEFTNQEGRTFQLDHGEIGPILAGLKVVKAWLTVAVGYQWELAVDGKYTWFDTLSKIRNPDFDHLRPEQTAALDHLTGLFETTSPFSHVKPEWKAQIQGIPTLLLSAVNDAQKGLRYAMAEKPTSQTHDLYIVGIGPEADVDPADLQNAIDLLERSKKYLTGEVNITYNQGIRSLKVNFAKLFQIDGLQGMLPYFKFYPYVQWNDTLSADTTWSSFMSYDANRELMTKMGYDPNKDYSLWIRPINSGFIDNSFEVVPQNWDPLFDTLPDGTHIIVPQVDTQLAVLTAKSGQPCTFTYQKKFNRVPSPGSSTLVRPDFTPSPSPFQSVPAVSEGTITLSSCRETVGGAEYAEYINVKTRGPFYFTNAAGDKTVELTDLDKYNDDLPALETKIFFRDPTFGGIFPEMTQTKIWGVIKSLQTVNARSGRECTDVMAPDGTFRYECENITVTDPSDLDLLISSTFWMDGLL